MFLYERVDWLGSRDRGFANRDLGKLAGNFAIYEHHFRPGTGMKAG